MRVRPLAVLAWTAVLFVVAWLALGFVAQWLRPQQLPVQPLDAVWATANREASEGLRTWYAGMGDLAAEPRLVDRCVPAASDEVQLAYFDTWFRDAFVLALMQDGDGARATWRTLRENHEARRFDVGQPVSRSVPATQWSQLRAALQARAFADLAPTEERDVIDGDLVVVESCLGGEYHVVIRSAPHGPEYAGFMRMARQIGASAGDVHGIPVMMVFEGTKESNE